MPSWASRRNKEKIMPLSDPNAAIKQLQRIALLHQETLDIMFTRLDDPEGGIEWSRWMAMRDRLLEASKELSSLEQ